MAVAGLLQGGGNPLVNYNYVDVAEGTGIQTYYLGTTWSNGTSQAILAANKNYSNEVVSWVYATGLSATVFAEVNERNFDVYFNLPKQINGKAFVYVPLGAQLGGDGTYNTFIKASICKLEGTTSTVLASASSAIVSYALAGAVNMASGAAIVSITVPTTHFRKGDALRLKIEQYGTINGAVRDGYFFFMNDPMDTGKLIPEISKYPVVTTSYLNVPFRLDI